MIPNNVHLMFNKYHNPITRDEIQLQFVDVANFQPASDEDGFSLMLQIAKHTNAFLALKFHDVYVLPIVPDNGQWIITYHDHLIHYTFLRNDRPELFTIYLENMMKTLNTKKD